MKYEIAKGYQARALPLPDGRKVMVGEGASKTVRILEDGTEDVIEVATQQDLEQLHGMGWCWLGQPLIVQVEEKVKTKAKKEK